MPYTLMKGLAWVLIAVVLGIIIGWLLRSVAAKRQIERAKQAGVDNDDQAELDRLRRRLANLEPVVNERDRLRAELDVANRLQPSSAPPPEPVRASSAVVDSPPAPKVSSRARDVDPLDDAAAVLGKRIQRDDLTVIDGIGPKIADLCHGIGIRTWAELSTTEVSLLRTMLNDAGQRFKAHDPSSWPEQAALLAVGDWSEFRAFTAQLDGGRPAD